MTLSFTFNGHMIEYTVAYRKRKTIGISISAEKGIQVFAPKWVNHDQLQEVVRKKALWILKNQAAIDVRKAKKPEKGFVDGECFLYLGQSYSLNISEYFESGIRIRLDRESSKIHVVIPSDTPSQERKEVLHQAFTIWYKQQARSVIDERIQFYSKIMQLHPVKVLIKEHRRIWGSCTGKNTVNVNWKIIMAPPHIVDYLIVHELAHIREKNHSSRFGDLVASILPDCKERAKWLKTNGFTLYL